MSGESNIQIVPKQRDSLAISPAGSNLIARGRVEAAELAAVFDDNIFFGFRMGDVRRLAVHGNADAQYVLGVFLVNQGPGRNPGAANWYRKAAEQGLVEAQFAVAGVCTRCGSVHDFAEAARWYRAVADQGCIWSQYHLGSLYYSGKGVSQDYMEAARWYQRSAEQGAPYAQYNLGIMYYEGTLTRDHVKAHMWVSLAGPTRTYIATIPGCTEIKWHPDALRWIEDGMTAEQIAEARSRVSAWRPHPSASRHGPDIVFQRLAEVLKIEPEGSTKPSTVMPSPPPPHPGEALKRETDRLGQLLRDELSRKFPLSEEPVVSERQEINRHILTQLGIIGGKHILDGLTDYNRWSAEMLAHIGDIIRRVGATNNMSVEQVLREVHLVAAGAARRFGVEAEPTRQESDQRVGNKPR